MSRPRSAASTHSSGSGGSGGSGGSDDTSCRARRGRPRSRSFIAEDDDLDPVTGLPRAALQPPGGGHRVITGGSPSSGSPSGGGSGALHRSAGPHGLSHRTLDIVNNLPAAAASLHLSHHSMSRMSPSSGPNTPPRLPRTASSDEEAAAAERRLLQQLRSTGSGGALPTVSGGGNRRDSLGSHGSRGKRKKDKQPEIHVKLLLLGDSGVGKTSLIQRYADHEFNPGTISTAGVDYRVQQMTVDGRRVKLQIWDTAGQERFQIITRAYYKGSHGIIMVYDVSDVATEDSFQSVQYRMNNLQQHGGKEVLAKVLVGNKVDLPAPRIPTAKGKALADKFGVRFFETSAKSGSNVKKVFTSITKDIVRRMINGAPSDGGGAGSGAGGGGGSKAEAKAPAAAQTSGKKGKGKKKCVIQ